MASVENVATSKRIKKYAQDRLLQISLLKINFSKISRSHPRFYDDVTDEFAKSDRRFELHYKYVSFQKLLPLFKISQHAPDYNQNEIPN